MLPQLRIRTEFSFRETFAPVNRVVERLKQIGAPGAGIVDGGTWGHVRFAKAMEKAGMQPYFGTELAVEKPDGRKPLAWFLANDLPTFYRFSSAARRPGADVEALAAECEGVLIRFAGAALTDPETFDYVDLQPASPFEQRQRLKLAARTGKPIVLTGDNAYAAPSDYDAYMGICGREKTTPQHILAPEEFRAQFKILSDDQYAEAIRNTCEVAKHCATSLRKAPLISVEGDLQTLAYAGRDRRLRLGHLKSWTVQYEERLERELQLIEQKNFSSYFIVVADLINWAKQRMLVGPGRGSSAGSLLCYCIGITEVDPIPHGLLFERFIDVTRADLPDIDIDFSDTKREQVFEYLADKYNKQNVARLGNINTLKPKSALAEVCKRFQIPDHAKHSIANVVGDTFVGSGDSLFGNVIKDALENSEPGRAFTDSYPVAAGILPRVENHTWHTGVHAAGVLVCNDPVTEYCTVTGEGIAQIDKPDAEYLNLLKIDALGLRTLGIIEDSGVVTGEELYALKLDDSEVFRIFNEGKFSGIFQFEGSTQRTITKAVDVKDFGMLDHLTALARPGPLGAGADQRYIERKNGRERPSYAHPALKPILGDTLGLVLYQEQVMRIVREIGNFSWEETSAIRKAISLRKGAEFFSKVIDKFIEGAAAHDIDRKVARQMFEDLQSFGVYGMNKSHTCAYAVISYWCAWMKRYHHLEYAAACLRSAKDEDQTYSILRELAAEGVEYTAFDLERSQLHWSVSTDGKLVGGFQNLVGFGPAKSAAAVEARDAGKIPPKMLERINKAEIRYAQLRPIQAAYGDIIRNPELHGCRPGSEVCFIEQLPDSGSVLLIAKLVKKKLGDLNDAFRVQKRGRMVRGQSIFVDLTVVDDTGGPLLCRIDRDAFDLFGRKAFSNLQTDDVLMIRGERIPNFNMVKVIRVKCLNNPEAL